MAVFFRNRIKSIIKMHQGRLDVIILAMTPIFRGTREVMAESARTVKNVIAIPAAVLSHTSKGVAAATNKNK